VPCNDISEQIVLRVSLDDRLLGYTLNKRTCGADIGRADLLSDWLAGLTTTAILGLDGGDLRDRYASLPEAEEFLYFKHLVAVQESVRVLVGAAAGAPGQACTTVEVSSDDKGLRFTGLIAVEGLTDKIKACGNCGSCGSRRRERQATPVAQGVS